MLLLRHIGGGQLAELDVTPLGGAGRAIVDFGAQGRTTTNVAVPAATITASNVVVAQIAALSTADHSADEHLVEEIDVRAGAIAPGVGFTVFARTRNVKLFGKYTVTWVWG